MQAPEADAAHWRRTRNVAAFVLVLWAIAGLGVLWVVPALDAAGLGPSPAVSRYAALAALLAFLALAIYANWRQDRTDRHYGHAD